LSSLIQLFIELLDLLAFVQQDVVSEEVGLHFPEHLLVDLLQLDSNLIALLGHDIFGLHTTEKEIVLISRRIDKRTSEKEELPGQQTLINSSLSWSS
jgi:hypothetical protein